MENSYQKYKGRKAHLYNRWSDKKQSIGSSHERQQTAASRAVERYGWKVVSKIEDQGVSGFKVTIWMKAPSSGVSLTS